MRKWTYLVAALLMSGTAATFTSCIDTDEPAGIENLRGAKAELILAKMRYQDALTNYRNQQVEMAKIDVEIKKCSLQIEQLKVEKETKKKEWEIASIDERIKLLAQQTEQQLLNLKIQNLQSQAEYEKAVIDLEAVMATYRDDKYVGSIQAAITALNTYRTAVATAENTLRGEQAKLISAQASLGSAYRQGLVNDSLKIEKAIDNQEFSLELVRGLKGLTEQDLATELTKIEQQIADIDNQSKEIVKKIAEIEAETEPINAEITKIENEALVPENSVTIPLEKVPAAIQKDVIYFLQNTEIYASASKYWDEFAAAPFMNEDEDAMTANFETTKTSLKKSFGSNNAFITLDGIVENLAKEIKENATKGYQTLFWGAYDVQFGTSTSSPATTEISAEAIAMAKQRKSEIEDDATKAGKIYTTDKGNWETAIENYKTKALAYGFEYNDYDATRKVIEDFRNLETAKQTDAEVAKVRKALADYYAKRMPLDEPSIITVTVTAGSDPVKLSEALGNEAYTDAMLKTLLTDGSGTPSYTYSIEDFLGWDIDLTDKDYDYYSNGKIPADPEDDGALQEFLRASNKAFGTGYTLAEARLTEPTDEEMQLTTSGVTTYVYNGTYRTYYKLDNAVKIFSNIESWIALTDYLEDEVAKKFEDALTDINSRVTEQRMLIADKNNEKYLLEVDNWALIGSNSNWSNTSGDTNPYDQPSTNKKSTLQTLKGSITTAISTNTFNVYVYEVTVNTTTGKFTSGTWANKSGTAEYLETLLSENITKATRALDIAKADITNFDNGWAYDGNTNIQAIETNIKNYEIALEEAKQNLQLAEARLNNLLDAYAGDSAAGDESTNE